MFRCLTSPDVMVVLGRVILRSVLLVKWFGTVVAHVRFVYGDMLLVLFC